MSLRCLFILPVVLLIASAGGCNQSDFLKTNVSKLDGMEMVYVPAGEFLMGSAEDDQEAITDEKPQHTVELDAFWIDKIEVTNGMFRRFIETTDYQTEAEFQGWGWAYAQDTWQEVIGAHWQKPSGPGSDLTGKDNHPVVQVSWNDAAAYCEWAERRLPTEAEWEKAARGLEGWLYPWGNEFSSAGLNSCDANCAFKWADPENDDGYAETAPTGSFPEGASPHGALDMAGNVVEWVQDWYQEDYYRSSAADNPGGPESGDGRGLRGGSYGSFQRDYRAAARFRLRQDTRASFIGFRCAQSEN